MQSQVGRPVPTMPCPWQRSPLVVGAHSSCQGLLFQHTTLSVHKPTYDAWRRRTRPRLTQRQIVAAISGPPTAPAPAAKKLGKASIAATLLQKLRNQKPEPRAPSGQPASEFYEAPLQGFPEPLGANLTSDGATNFAVFSSNAEAVSLCLFTLEDLQAGRVTHELALDAMVNRTGDVWHVLLPGLDASLLYGYRMSGPHQDKAPPAAAVPESTAAAPSPESEEAVPPKPKRILGGQRFDPGSVLLDPYARAIVGRKAYGELGPDLQYDSPGVLGLAPTWPQCAGALPSASSFDWQGDAPLRIPMHDLVIYEMHVRGFTRDPSSGVAAPGTFQGLVEKLDYIQGLGVNAIELLPVHEFNELEYYQVIPGSNGAYRYNFWGYSTVGFFAPMARYSAAGAAGGSGAEVMDEFKLLVREAHKRGIEVIMDVVFNHTAEGNEMGPTISFRGLDNRVYYMLAPEGQYYNYSGCGNTFNCNHPLARKFIIDCLRYWVVEMHVDGFRFDLASILTRAHSAWERDGGELQEEEGPVAGAPANGAATAAGMGPGIAGDAAAGAVGAAAAGGVPGELGGDGEPEAAKEKKPIGGPMVDANGIMTDGAGTPTGTPLSEPPLVEAISEDPILRGTKLIAEAWDCDGLTQVGAFPHYGGRWAEWNGHFRDTARQFIKGTEGQLASAFASAICGSPNLYLHEQPAEGDWWGNNGGRRWRGGRAPWHSINFITAHDGFTLADLVAFNEKHNDANGEGNRDGESHNLSWNCGAEGATKDAGVLRLRQRQMRNFMCALLLSHGVPMLQMGDEFGHTKNGNNNTYCHDSPLNWVDWNMVEKDSNGFGRFVRRLINFRRSRPELRRAGYIQGDEIAWHGVRAGEPDWSDSARLLAFSLVGAAGPGSGGLYVAFNTAHLPQLVQLPRWPGQAWQLVADTSKVAPYDFIHADEALSEAEVAAAHAAASQWTGDGYYPLLPWSCIVMQAVPVTAQPAMPDRATRAAGVLPTKKGAAVSGNAPPAGAAAKVAMAAPEKAKPTPSTAGPAATIAAQSGRPTDTFQQAPIPKQFLEARLPVLSPEAIAKSQLLSPPPAPRTPPQAQPPQTSAWNATPQHPPDTTAPPQATTARPPAAKAPPTPPKPTPKVAAPKPAPPEASAAAFPSPASAAAKSPPKPAAPSPGAATAGVPASRTPPQGAAAGPASSWGLSSAGRPERERGESVLFTHEELSRPMSALSAARDIASRIMRGARGQMTQETPQPAAAPPPPPPAPASSPPPPAALSAQERTAYEALLAENQRLKELAASKLKQKQGGDAT